jgi:enoyl-CoA hydratase/carnithine racemase
VRTDFETLVIEQDGGVLHVVLNRPDKRNAMSHLMHDEIDTALDEAELDPEVAAVVLRGAGKMFSAGHDLGEQYAGKDFRARVFPVRVPSTSPAFPRAWYFRKPLLGAVHGFAGAGAVALLGCCDFLIAAPGTRFSLEVFRGVAPEMDWLPLYAQLPMRVMEKLFLMGGWFDAEQALQLHFVQRVVPEDEVVDEASRWAHQVGRSSGESWGRAKESMRRAYELLGLANLHALLDRPEPLSPEVLAALQDRDVKDVVAQRDAGIDPDISRV